jgi:predicted dehydrogenase
MARRRPITVGVVGLGRIGWSFHARKLHENPAYELVACVDPLPERRKEAADAFGCRTFARLNRFLDSGLAELAVICTRSADHCRHSVAALRAGLHVLTEKPMAMSVREVDRMIAAAKKAGKLLTVHQSARAGEALRFIRETIDSGILGEVFWIRHTQHGFVRRNDWQMLKKYGGGYLNNNGSHAVDACLLLLDAPVQDVWGDLKHMVAGGDADDWFKIVIRGKNGRVIEVEQSYACAFPQLAYLVAGTAGTMQVLRREAHIKYFDPKKLKPLPSIPPYAVQRAYGTAEKLPWREKTVPVKARGRYPDFHDALAASIRRRKRLLVTPESVRDQIRVLDLARKSAGWK